MTQSALSGIRALEISGTYGAYCGKLFADLGASVTLLEPPGGSPMRAKPPFAGDQPGPENSLPFAYFAANKASVSTDLTTPAGQARLAELAGVSDLIILSDHPDAGCVDLGKLCRGDPKLVAIRITPFGTTGPYAGFRGDDLSLMAMGGLLTLAGFPDLPPAIAYGEQGLLAADQFGAVAAIAAVLRAERTGRGELIDLSIQESVVMALENAAQTYQLEGVTRCRTAGARRAGTGIFPCKDGEIYLLAGGIGETAMWGNFAQWMVAEGIAGADLFGSSDWNDSAPGADHAFEAIFLPYAMRTTKEALYQGGKTWRVPVAPMSTPEDLLDNAQLDYRGYFVDIPDGHPLSGTKVPGAPYKLGATPWCLHHPAPLLETGAARVAHHDDKASRHD